MKIDISLKGNISLGCLLLLLVLVVLIGIYFFWKPTLPHYVEGIVKMDGIVQPDVKIMFHPKGTASGETASGTTDAEGFYTLTSSNGPVGRGAFTGNYIVTVSRMKVMKLPSEEINPEDEREHAYQELLPSVYQDKKNSPLQVTVERKKKNVINWDLSKNP